MNMYMSACVYICVRAFMCACVCMHARVRVRVCVRMYTRGHRVRRVLNKIKCCGHGYTGV